MATIVMNYRGNSQPQQFPNKRCIHCDSDTILSSLDLREFFSGGSIIITNVPAYHCTNCNRVFGHIHASREAQLQAVRELKYFNPSEANRLSKVIENWDILIPERINS